jgi:hypothetical protein
MPKPCSPHGYQLPVPRSTGPGLVTYSLFSRPALHPGRGRLVVREVLALADLVRARVVTQLSQGAMASAHPCAESATESAHVSAGVPTSARY